MIGICRFRISWRIIAAALVLGFLSADKAFAGAPQITKLSLRGLRTGATTTLTIEGTDLLPNPRLVLPFPIAAQTIQKAATPSRIEVEITLAASVSPGMA